MRAVLQRVKLASVSVEGEKISEIGHGLLILLAVSREDTREDLEYMANKCKGLRIFSDDEGLMNLSVEDVGGEILVVSQFTLYGDARKGRRPSFTQSAAGEEADKFYQDFKEILRGAGLEVQGGAFGADMDVELINDGPVTILLDSSKLF